MNARAVIRCLSMLFCIILLLSFVVTPLQVAAAGGIVLDGEFSDWAGRMHVDDPTGDTSDTNADIIKFYWTNNPDESVNYWMIERLPSDHKINYLLYIDTNNNGNFLEHVDRLVQVVYEPKNDSSKVDVIVRYADDTTKISTSSNNDWGASEEEGGAKVEFKARFADLGIGKGQTIRMYLISYFDRSGTDDQADTWKYPQYIDRVPDGGDIQWTPVPILGYLGVALLVPGVVLTWYLVKRYKWFSR